MKDITVSYQKGWSPNGHVYEAVIRVDVYMLDEFINYLNNKVNEKKGDFNCSEYEERLKIYGKRLIEEYKENKEAGVLYPSVSVGKELAQYIIDNEIYKHKDRLLNAVKNNNVKVIF